LNYIVGDFEDTHISTEVKDINTFASAYINSKAKFQKYLDKNKELLSIKKLRNNIELDNEDLKLHYDNGNLIMTYNDKTGESIIYHENGNPLMIGNSYETTLYNENNEVLFKIENEEEQ